MQLVLAGMVRSVYHHKLQIRIIDILYTWVRIILVFDQFYINLWQKNQTKYNLNKVNCSGTL